jgi:uncharacterized RDD family membrane protein YckC
MTRRFDEIELYPDSFPVDILPHPAEVLPPPAITSEIHDSVGVRKRSMAFLVDLVLFVALALALTPLMPPVASEYMLAWTALAGFLLLNSFFYFVGSWLVWGKTLGGTLLDVRIIGADGEPATLREAILRWVAIFLSIGTGGIGFALALLPSGRSLSDRISNTTAISA